MKRLFLVVTFTGAAVALTGCHSQLTFSTPSGIREYGRYRNGSLAIAKSPRDKQDHYHTTQKHYEDKKTERRLGGLFDSTQVEAGYDHGS